MRIANTTALSILCLGLGISQTGVAADSDTWQFEVTPYLLAAGMDGTVGVGGVTTDIDVSFSDIMDNLDMGFMGLFTAQKGPWTFGLEGIYMKLEDDGEFDLSFDPGHPDGLTGEITGELDVTNFMYVAQASAGYRLLDNKTKLDVIGGLRYTKLKLELDYEVVGPIRTHTGSPDGSESWTDAVVGLRVLHPVSEAVDLVGYVDVGGGGSDLTYQFIAGVNWKHNERFTTKLGYRYIYWDYEDDGIVWDMTADGPYLGLGIRF